MTPLREHSLPASPCATSTAHTGRHNSTLKNAAHHPRGCTLHRGYPRLTARLTVAGDTPKDLATRRWPPTRWPRPPAPQTSGEGRPVSNRPPSPSPNQPWYGGVWTPVPGRTPRRRSRPGCSPGTTPANRGRHPGTGPRTVRYRPSCESSPRAVAGRGCFPWCPASAARCGRWTPQPRCHIGPARSPESASPAGCWYRKTRRRRRLIDVRKHHAGGQQLLALGFRVAARQLGDSGPAGADVSVDFGHRSPVQLVVIALSLCDPHLNKLEGVNCGPVSQTRVCDTGPGRLIH